MNIFVGGGSINEAHHQKRNLALDVNHMDVYHYKGAFTLSVRDSSVESPNTHASHLELTPTYHEHFMVNIHLTLNYRPFNIGCHLDFHLTLT